MEQAVVPAIIAANQEQLDSMLEKLHFSKALHLDVMDGQFVRATSLNFAPVLSPAHTYEVHLMVADPFSWILEYGRLPQVLTIVFHYEALQRDGGEIERTLRQIKNIGPSAGLAVNPDTPIQLFKPFLNALDRVLLMTVHPGQYGADFVPESIDRIRELRSLYTGPIAVDGHQDPTYAPLCKEAGATLFLSGSYIAKSQDPETAFKTLVELVG